MSVSVIIPVYKVEKYIERCAESLFAQTLTENVEFVFVDDATPDNSIPLLKAVLARYPHRQSQVKIIPHEQNRGNAAARNTGLSHTEGDYIIQIDGDDWIEADMLESMYRLAIEKKADMVCCNCVEEFGNKRRTVEFPAIISPEEMIAQMPSNLLYSSLWNKLIKRSLYSEHNIKCFENINNWVDIGLIIRLCFFTRTIEIIQKAFYHYNRENENSVSKKPNSRRIEDMIYCSLEINRFFVKNGADKKYNLTLKYISYLAKDRLLYDKSVRDYRRWKALFPETHAHIWQFSQLSLFKKITFSLAACGYNRLAINLLNIRAAVGGKFNI
ncbi:MAG: glycosyltransferase [Prevotellaceae bacterium]|jgi:glycosyltransferase involved in cell wall biosynthesis|nr:glycosyltransferase [Prevotellaceae bacterium]